jgi:cell division protein FtsB
MLSNDPSSSLSVQERHEDDDRWLRTRRRHRFLSGLCTILALMIAGAAWYAYPILKRHDSSLAQLVHTQQALDKIDGSLQMQRSNVAEWSKDQQQLRDQVTKLGGEIRSRIEVVRKETGHTGENLFHTMQAQIERQIEAMKSRVAALESSRDADKAQIAALQEELGQVRGEVSEQNRLLSDVRREMENQNHDAGTENRLASLQESEERNRQSVEAINNRLAVRRVDFEVSKGHSRELAPGISLGITGTDVAFRRVSGWMWVLPDRRTIWLRQQGAQEPVDFYGYRDGMKRELVITSVTKGSVAGYLLLPMEGSAAAESASSLVHAGTAIGNASE